jgi:hypothetical protein
MPTLAAFDGAEAVIDPAHVEGLRAPIASGRLGFGEVSWQNTHRLLHWAQFSVVF